jgi:MoaA/NifB/PqqE/SkfB family radical SAM enzyme
MYYIIMTNYTRIFQSSPRYWEDVESINLAQMTQDGSLPFILLGQPPICDDNCRRCFIHVNNYRSELKNTLSREESRNLLDQAREHGAIALEISGEGEPTLSQNLPSIIEHASKN